MPRPIVDLGRGRTKLWSKTAVANWARSAELRAPQAIASAELAEITAHGKPLATGVFRSAYVSARQHALGGGRNPREIDRSRRSALEVALNSAQRVDPAFRVTLPDRWLDEPLTGRRTSRRGGSDAIR
jgi:hypothetical protein